MIIIFLSQAIIIIPQFPEPYSLGIAAWILPALVTIKNPVLMTISMGSQHNWLLKNDLSYPDKTYFANIFWFNWPRRVQVQREKDSQNSQILRSYSSEKHLLLMSTNLRFGSENKVKALRMIFEI